MTERPPAIVVGADSPIGLTVIRELGERGVPVHAIARARNGVGLYSRWAASRHVRPRGEPETVALINRVAGEHGARCLLAVSEIDLLMVRAAADAGRLTPRALVPSLEALRRVNDKFATYSAAGDCGVPVPRTWLPESPSPPADLRYPVIVKWRDPAGVSPALAERGLALVKAEYAYDAAGLARVLERYRPLGAYPMVQQYVPGVGLGHMVYMDRGEPVLTFQHIRRAEWPPEGGTSTVCESLAPEFHADWMARSVELLQRLAWEGAAMVEYRYDAATGQRALMEINGRFWGSLPLAYHAGAHFAWTTYAVQCLRERPAARPYRAGVVCRYMVPETRRVLTLMFRPRAIQDRAVARRPVRAAVRYLLAFFRPRTHYYVFSLRDPKPFFADMGFMLAKMLRGR